MGTANNVRRPRWDTWQHAKVGTQPAVVRFKVHNNPTKCEKLIGKKVEFQVHDTMNVETGIVDRANEHTAFIELF